MRQVQDLISADRREQERDAQTPGPLWWLVAVMLLLTPPSLAGASAWFSIASTSSNVSLFQVALIIIGIVAVITARENVLRYPFIRLLAAAWWMLACYNVAMAMVVSSTERQLGLARGVFNLSAYALGAIAIALLAKDAPMRVKIARSFMVYGGVIAASAVLETALFYLGRQYLGTWLWLVSGYEGPVSTSFRAVNRSYEYGGISRVGGVVGAPETLGWVLTFTIPFILVARLTKPVRVALLSLYALAAVLTASRTLTFALVIFALVVARARRTARPRAARAVLVLGLMAATAMAVNPGVFTRLSASAVTYEYQWRSEQLRTLIDVGQDTPGAWISGLGLGAGIDVDFGFGYPIRNGILGGDLAVAWGLGGPAGILIFGAIAGGILSTLRRLRGRGGPERLAMSTYVITLVGLSLALAQLTQVILWADMVGVTLLAVPAVMAGAAED